MFIYVGCAGGASSSMLCNRLANAIQTLNSDKRVTSDAVSVIMMNPLAYQENYDIIVAYGGIDYIRSQNAAEFGALFDIVMVAPQVRYHTKDKMKLLQDYPTIVADFPMKLYGTMDAIGVNQFIQNLLEVKDNE